jgi:hypothetical protein
MIEIGTFNQFIITVKTGLITAVSVACLHTFEDE